MIKREIKRDIERQNDTKRQREIKRDKERQRETKRDKERQREKKRENVRHRHGAWLIQTKQICRWNGERQTLTKKDKQI